MFFLLHSELDSQPNSIEMVKEFFLAEDAKDVINLSPPQSGLVIAVSSARF